MFGESVEHSKLFRWFFESILHERLSRIKLLPPKPLFISAMKHCSNKTREQASYLKRRYPILQPTIIARPKYSFIRPAHPHSGTSSLPHVTWVSDSDRAMALCPVMATFFHFNEAQLMVPLNLRQSLPEKTMYPKSDS